METSVKTIKNYYGDEIKMEYVILNNGVKMPKVFFGCYQIPPEETEKAVAEAIKLGYRGIDTA